MANIDCFYPEMNQKAAPDAQLIIERLYKKSKVTCLNGISLPENRSIEFMYTSKINDNKVYYVSDSGVKKLTKQYRVSFSQSLD